MTWYPPSQQRRLRKAHAALCETRGYEATQHATFVRRAQLKRADCEDLSQMVAEEIFQAVKAIIDTGALSHDLH